MTQTGSEILILRSPGGGSGLQLRFERIVDRFHQTIAWIDQNGNELDLLQSVEGTAQNDFPPSPPLQQLHWQEINGTPVMLGVGMAGRGHWSASMSIHDCTGSSIAIENCESALVIEHALNMRGKVDWAGCTWQPLSEIEFQIDSDNTAGPVRSLVARIGDGIRLIVRPNGLIGCELELVAGHVQKQQIIAKPASSKALSRPLRWNFEIFVMFAS